MASKQPVTPLSAHRLFPAVVAIWFAALFGLGCAVLPATVIEGLVASTGLPAILPAAAPPLGFTAQATVALVAAAFGALCGFALARKLAFAQGAVRPAHVDARHFPVPGRRDNSGARRPLSIKDELDDEPLFASSFTAEEPLAGRRRSLMPASGQPAPEPEAFTAFEPEFPPEAPYAQEPEYLEPISAEEPAIFDQADPQEIRDPEAEATSDLPAETPVFDPPATFEPEANAPAPAQPAPTGVLPGDPRADVGQMGIVQLTERLGHALQGRLDRGQLRPLAPPPALLAELAGLPARPAIAEPQTVTIPTAVDTSIAEEEAAVAEFAPPPFGPQDFSFDEIDPQEAIFGASDIESAPPRSATFAPSMTEALRPAALQLDEFGEDEEEDESEFAEEQYGSLLAIRGLTGESREPVSEIDEDEGDEGYPEDSHPFHAQPSDARPADTPPSDADSAPRSQAEDETEALRRALAQLQRMSGAA